MSNQGRVPAGVPTGGQFSEMVRPEPDSVLEAPRVTVAQLADELGARADDLNDIVWADRSGEIDGPDDDGLLTPEDAETLRGQWRAWRSDPDAQRERLDDFIESVEHAVEDRGMAAHFEVAKVNSSGDSEVWLEVGAQVAERCCANQSDPGPAWDWVDEGSIRGTRPAQCDGCGSHGATWATSGARQVDLDDENLDATVDEMMASVASSVEARSSEEMVKTRERLDEQLEETLSDYAAGDKSADEMVADHPLYPGDGPGVFIEDDGSVVVWDYPNLAGLNSDSFIEVRSKPDVVLAAARRRYIDGGSER